MGILKLAQDLYAYAEDAVLGCPRLPVNQGQSDGRIRVSRLVIDGPSLVYFVYDRLRRSHLHPHLAYKTINEGVTSVLRDLEQQGVEIVKICFDGGLPVSKRPTRLDRLQKQRRQLELYRRCHPEGIRRSKESQLDNDGVVDVWTTTPNDFSTRVVPPAPPFMIARAIDHLRSSFSPEVVEIVPGEADVYGAKFAQSHSAAILSNDSDMALYDLGERGTVVLLQSLDRVEREDAGPEITASCLRLHETAKRLQIPSLRVLAYDRWLDVSASSTIIRNRARARSSALKVDSSLEAFAKQYDVSDVHLFNQPLEIQEEIDPRLAELYCQMYAEGDSILVSDELHMYLPFLFEDLTRDAAWSYGSLIRQMAYSILHLGPRGRRYYHSVIEFSRSGDRVRGLKVALLHEADICRLMAGLIDCIESSDQVRLQTANALPNAITTRLFLLSVLKREKVQMGKPAMSQHQAKELFGVLDTQTVAWDVIHLHGNMQALTYSLSILQQAWALVSRLDIHKSCTFQFTPAMHSLAQVGGMKSQWMTHVEITAITTDGDQDVATYNNRTSLTTVSAGGSAESTASTLEAAICKLVPEEKTQANSTKSARSKPAKTRHVRRSANGPGQKNSKQRSVAKAGQNMFGVLVEEE